MTRWIWAIWIRTDLWLLNFTLLKFQLYHTFIWTTHNIITVLSRLWHIWRFRSHLLMLVKTNLNIRHHFSWRQIFLFYFVKFSGFSLKLTFLVHSQAFNCISCWWADKRWYGQARLLLHRTDEERRSLLNLPFLRRLLTLLLTLSLIQVYIFFELNTPFLRRQ